MGQTVPHRCESLYPKAVEVCYVPRPVTHCTCILVQKNHNFDWKPAPWGGGGMYVIVM